MQLRLHSLDRQVQAVLVVQRRSLATRRALCRLRVPSLVRQRSVNSFEDGVGVVGIAAASVRADHLNQDDRTTYDFGVVDDGAVSGNESVDDPPSVASAIELAKVAPAEAVHLSVWQVGGINQALSCTRVEQHGTQRVKTASTIAWWHIGPA